jgi:lipoprotein-anchoring transpeptidase ErfK/SrfK
MSHRRARCACAATAALALALAGCGADVEHPATTTSPAARTTPTATTPAGEQPAGTSTTPQQAQRRLRPPLAFHVRRRAQLRQAPGGKVVATIRPKTEFKSPTILAVANRRPGWVLVRTSVAKHHVGWLPSKAGVLFSQPRTIVIDLSKRTLTLFHRGSPSNRYKIAIGARGTETPTGKFAVTDRLKVQPGTPYGCCILALTAHQPKIAQGWGGGDRVAIHATPDDRVIGKAVSHGCLRATNKALRQLMRKVRLGTPVTVHQ